jgi:hypothetical protein
MNIHDFAPTSKVLLEVCDPVIAGTVDLQLN